MTATTVPQDLAARGWNGLLKVAAIVALFVVLAAGSFAIGRSTADDSVTVVRPTLPATSATSSAPAATDASCGRTAHTPPC